MPLNEKERDCPDRNIRFIFVSPLDIKKDIAANSYYRLIECQSLSDWQLTVDTACWILPQAGKLNGCGKTHCAGIDEQRPPAKVEQHQASSDLKAKRAKLQNMKTPSHYTELV